MVRWSCIPLRAKTIQIMGVSRCSFHMGKPPPTFLLLKLRSNLISMAHVSGSSTALCQLSEFSNTISKHGPVGSQQALDSSMLAEKASDTYSSPNSDSSCYCQDKYGNKRYFSLSRKNCQNAYHFIKYNRLCLFMF